MLGSSSDSIVSRYLAKTTIDGVNKLSDNDALEVYTYVYEARNIWYCLGLVLEFTSDFLEEIKAEGIGASESLRKMLITWLRTGKERNWKTLALALGQEIVGKNNLKEKIWQDKGMF